MPTCPHCKMEIPEGATLCGHCRSTTPRGVAIGCGTLVGLFALFMMFCTGSKEAATTSDTAASSDALRATAACETERVVVENLSADVWEDARIEVNGSWEFRPGVIIPGRQPYLAGLFTKSDGTRLSLYSVTCNQVSIHATVKGKRMHWNGGR